MDFVKRHQKRAIEERAGLYSAVVVTGPRQVGKSTLLKEALKDARYVTLDTLSVRQAAIDFPSAFFLSYAPPVVVDEIQYAPRLLSEIKLIADNTKAKGQFYLTGSQAFHLMEGVSESLSGRVGVLELLGLSYREIKGVEYDKEFLPTTDHIDAIKKYAPRFDYNEIIEIMQKGSFPVIYDEKYGEASREIFFGDYITTYIERDVSALGHIIDKSAFIKFVTAAAALTGQMLNLTTLADMCAKDVNTVKRWLSILETSGLVFLLKPYYTRTAKRLVKAPKLYFLDTGLACYLGGWHTPEQLMKGAMSGHIFETFVFTEILKSYQNAGKKARDRFFYYRDFDGKEIDLVIDGGACLYPIEIKQTDSPKRSDIAAFNSLEKLGKPIAEGGVVCLCETPLYLTEKIRVIPVNMI